MKQFNFNTNIFVAFAAFLTLAVAVFYIFDFGGVKKEAKKTVENISENIVTVPESEQVKSSEEAGTVAPKYPSGRAPYQGEPIIQLNPGPGVTASVGAAFVEKYQKELRDAAERVGKNIDIDTDWLGIAYVKKLFNNYLGTRDALEYAKIINPQNAVAHFNLGELYGYELHDPDKAEKNYIAALRLDPYHFDYYVGLANFYEDVLKNPKKAEEILLSALGKIPHTEVNLFATIGAFYRDQRNYEEAIEYFEKAFNTAIDTGVKKTIQNEIDYIRSKMETP